MERVIEALEYILDQKKLDLEKSKSELKRFNDEKQSLDKKIESLKVSYACETSVISNLLKEGKAETDPVVVLHRMGKKSVHDDLLIGFETIKDLKVLINMNKDLISDLKLDIDEIKSFLKSNRPIRKGECFELPLS